VSGLGKVFHRRWIVGHKLRRLIRFAPVCRTGGYAEASADAVRRGALADPQAAGASWGARRAVDADVADGAVAQFFR
jgi:hypothetical protein